MPFLQCGSGFFYGLIRITVCSLECRSSSETGYILTRRTFRIKVLNVTKFITILPYNKLKLRNDISFLISINKKKPTIRLRGAMIFLKKIFFKAKHIIFYGSGLAILVFSLKWLQWKFLIVDNSLDIYIGLIAVFFTILGVWIATQLTKPRIEKVIVEKKVFIPQPQDFALNETELKKLNLTNREYEVLQLVVKGHSNSDIANILFLSLSTIKTHISNLYVKMNVNRRAQAIEKAKRLKIVE
jgi:DNA-binding CsgD family transcriptional regulator